MHAKREGVGLGRWWLSFLPFLAAFVVWPQWTVLAEDLSAEEEVRVLSVRIDIAPEAADMTEPVALDLGLGFPLWLYPLGYGLGEQPSFGAMPQQTDAGDRVAAGASATFTFSPNAPSGPDLLGTTRALLSGVKVKDIRRVGFRGGAGDWVLARYQIQINDQLFASADVGGSPARFRSEATATLAGLEGQPLPLERELEDLEDLELAGLATAEDRDRRQAVSQSLAALQCQQNRLRGQLDGRYCWYEDPQAVSGSKLQEPSGQATVTLVPTPGASFPEGSDLYLAVGGHKYALSPGQRTSQTDGSQGYYECSLDLHSGPVAASDWHDYALGVLARCGKATGVARFDRILINVDERTVYDSDEKPEDRKSLQQAQLVPPVRINAEGNLVSAESSAGQGAFWQPGKPNAATQSSSQAPLNAAEANVRSGLAEPDWSAQIPYAAQSRNESESLRSGDSRLAVGDLTSGVDPRAVGTAVQIDRVELEEASVDGGMCEVRWQIEGDEATVKEYQVSLIAIHPDAQVPLDVPMVVVAAPTGTRQCQVSLGQFLGQSLDYIAPQVMAVPTDPKQTPHQRIGPATMLPLSAEQQNGLELQSTFAIGSADQATRTSGVVMVEGDFRRTASGVWLLGQAESHNALLIDKATRGWNLAAKALPGEVATVRLRATELVGSQRVAGYVGFLGKPMRPSDISIRMLCTTYDDPQGAETSRRPRQFSTDVRLVSDGRQPPSPMPLLEQLIDSASSGFADPWHLDVEFEIEVHTIDPQHPPALFGLHTAAIAPEMINKAKPNGELTQPPSRVTPADYVVDMSEMVPLILPPLPPGGKETTPWPQINGTHGPVDLPLPNVTCTLGWNATEIKGCSQIEYEVAYGNTFTKLEGDEPGRVTSGIVKKAAGTQTIDFAALGKGLGTYYVRVAAQNASGQEVALRSQPAVVRVVAAGGSLPVLVPGVLVWTFANFTNYFSPLSPSDWQVDEGPVYFWAGSVYNPFLRTGYDYFQWHTTNSLCVSGRLDVVAGDFGKGPSIHTATMPGRQLQQGGHGTSKWPLVERFGHFEMKPIYQKLLAANPAPWQVYALRVTPLDAAGKSCGDPSPTKYMQYAPAYAKCYIKSVSLHGCDLDPRGCMVGDVAQPTLDPAGKGVVIVPAWNCWKDHSALLIGFSELMDRDSVEKALTFSPPWPQTITTWYDKKAGTTDWETIGVGHLSNLWFDTVYTITLDTKAKTKSGQPLIAGPVRWQFRTLPYAADLATIEKFDYPKVIVTPPGTLNVNYRVKDTEEFWIDLWQSVAHSEIVPTKAPLPEGTLSSQVYAPKPAEPGIGTYISAVVGNALGYFEYKHSFQLKELPDVNADLALNGSKSFLVPGVPRGGLMSVSPVVVVEKYGSDPIPQELLGQIKVVTTYEVSSISALGKPLPGKPGIMLGSREVVCTNTLADAKGTSPHGPWYIVPTCAEIPQGVFTNWTKLYRVMAQLELPLRQTVQPGVGFSALVPKSLFPNDQLKNNTILTNSVVVLGSGAGPYEVVAYRDPGFKSFAAAWESPPVELQRQVDLWSPATGLNDQISSIEIGSQVKAWVFEHDYWGRRLMVSSSAANLGNMDNCISSLIITDQHAAEPWGVYVTSGGTPVVKFFPFCYSDWLPWEATIGPSGARQPKLMPKTGLQGSVHYMSYKSLGPVSGNIFRLDITGPFNVRLSDKNQQWKSYGFYQGPNTHLVTDPAAKGATYLDISLTNSTP